MPATEQAAMKEGCERSHERFRTDNRATGCHYLPTNWTAAGQMARKNTTRIDLPGWWLQSEGSVGVITSVAPK